MPDKFITGSRIKFPSSYGASELIEGTILRNIKDVLIIGDTDNRTHIRVVEAGELLIPPRKTSDCDIPFAEGDEIHYPVPGNLKTGKLGVVRTIAKPIVLIEDGDKEVIRIFENGKLRLPPIIRGRK